MTPRIISIEMVGHHVEHDDTNRGQFWNEVEKSGRDAYRGRGEYEFSAEVICSNGNTVTVNVSVVVEDGEFYDVQGKVMNMRVENGKKANGEIKDPDPLLDDISEAMDDYDGGLEFKATQKVQQLINSGGGPCS